MSKYNLVYMARPIYGGWVSFTAHLSKRKNYKLYRISNKTEKTTRDYGYDVQMNFALGRAFNGEDYAHALRHRQGFTAQFLECMNDIDVIVTPTTGGTAAPIPEHALPKGESNLVVLERLSRFAAVGNLTGFPAIAVPAGYDRQGLPISCQFMGRPWEEALLLRIARVAEQNIGRVKPTMYFDLLGE